jgi:hypothetical protein
MTNFEKFKNDLDEYYIVKNSILYGCGIYPAYFYCPLEDDEVVDENCEKVIMEWSEQEIKNEKTN